MAQRKRRNSEEDGYSTGKLVFVEWVDSVEHSGWAHKSESATDHNDHELKCQSVGWIVRKTTQSVTLAQSRSTLRNVAARIQIPRCAISYMQDIE